MLVTAPPTQVDIAIARLDGWFETMRGPGGYTGPVVHWWQQSLMYTGPALDWRYEGIIIGYLHLWQRTGSDEWLQKARRAADDLVAGQLSSGHYAASAFEINPATAGTPHEAACNVALLTLALKLRQAGAADWQHYSRVAEHNLRMFHLAQLWDPATSSFWDSPKVPSFVPNKAATICEALFLLAEITGDSAWVEQYALPTLDRICEHQVDDSGRLAGGIAQNSFAARRVDKYLPMYIARCVPALLCGYEWTGSEQYASSALQAMKFIARWTNPDGTLPTVVYANQQVNRYPIWVAPIGDVLRAGDEARRYGFDDNMMKVERWMLNGQDVCGGMRTACGFDAQSGGRPGQLPDLRDVLHVAGWCDKAFRYLAAHVSPSIEPQAIETFSIDCTFRGQRMCLVETNDMIEVSRKQQVCYRWHKGQNWPEIASEEFWLR